MTNNLIRIAEDALQDALLFKKNTLDQVADLVVTQMKHHTKDSNWLCNVVPADIDTGLCFNYDCVGSVCFSFGDEKQKYDAKISKLRDGLGKPPMLSPAMKTQSPSTEIESPLSDILHQIETDPNT